jgi:CheY-like chemotaxis protein
MSRLQDAMDAISEKIDLILTDIRLDESIADDREGLELVRYARAKYPEMPVVAMSALQETDVAQQALAAGATRFLPKPIVISNLKTLLDELMQGTR